MGGPDDVREVDVFILPRIAASQTDQTALPQISDCDGEGTCGEQSRSANGDFFQQRKANLTSTASADAATRVAAAARPAVRRGVGIISAPA
jgi:hypothetical protein